MSYKEERKIFEIEGTEKEVEFYQNQANNLSGFLQGANRKESANRANNARERLIRLKKELQVIREEQQKI